MTVMMPALLLDETIARLVAIRGVRPDIALVGLLVVILRFGPTVAVWTGFLSGIFLDVATPENLGARALSLSVSAYLIARAAEHVDAKSLPIQLLLLLALGVLDGLIREFAVRPADPLLALSAFVRIDVLDLVYTLVVMFLVLALSGQKLTSRRAVWRVAR